MSVLSNQASTAADQAQAYVAGLFAALGSHDPLVVLGDMPAALERAVAGLSPAQQSEPKRPGKWSVRQVVQHLADSELVGGFRFRMVLAHEAPSIPGYDQDLWADRLQYHDSDIPTAIHEFTTLRGANMRLLQRATPADLERVMRHTERGDESLAKLVRMYAGHDLTHLAQIRRIRLAIGAPESAT